MLFLKLPECNVDYFKSFLFSILTAYSIMQMAEFLWLFIRNLLANHYCHIVMSINQVILISIPRFSLSSHVRTESLYGMKSLFFFFLLCGKQKINKSIYE